MSPPTLYIIATPIGNLADMTFRAVEVLKGVDLIVCEDTRRSRILLDHYGIQKPLFSLFDASEKRRAPFLLEKLKAGETMALISDAGTPGIADPGYRLIRGAIEEGIPVEFIPGPSALIAALVLSGLPADRFIFEGFFPVKEGEKRRRLLSLKEEDRTVIFYESPYRLVKTLKTMQEVLGDIPIVVARELTKKFQELVRKKISEAIARFEGKKAQGEFVVLFCLR
ncbi:MAG: 16S rRNA (cytidine(1402)-2'-O)-methyltransferase [Candidatus Omnitrophica bacterium]|nr:16S rRNA (cytidine(1402)-2'-O)-methyltransferase [Candidatus Omnitrophota bacterium]